MGWKGVQVPRIPIEPDPVVLGRARLLARLAALGVGSLAALILTGWLTRTLTLVTLLAQPEEGAGSAVAMVASTAFGLLLGATGLLLGLAGRLRLARGAGWLLGLGTFGAACQLLAGQVPLLDAGLIRWMHFPSNAVMALPAAFVLMLAGISLARGRRGMGGRLAPHPVPALGVLFLGFLALLGYALNLPLLAWEGRVVRMALPTSLLTTLLGAGLVVGASDRGWLGLFAVAGPGGMAVRRMMPVVLGFPILLAWAVQVLWSRSWLSANGALLVVVVAVIMAMGALVMGVGWSLDRLMRQQEQERLVLAEREARLRLVMEASRDPVLLLGLDRQVQYASPATRAVLGMDPATLDGTALQAALDPASTAIWVQFWRSFRDTGRFPDTLGLLSWRRPDGRVVVADHATGEVREGDRVTGLLLVIRPIEARPGEGPSAVG